MKSFKEMKSVTNGELLKELESFTEKQLLVLIAYELSKTQQKVDGLEFTIQQKEIPE